MHGGHKPRWFLGTGRLRLWFSAPDDSMWGPVRLHKNQGAPVPPRPALALAKPAARFLSRHSIGAMEVAASDLSADRQARPTHHPGL